MQPDEPRPLSPEDRRHELARILARGVLRLCRRLPAVAPPGSRLKELAQSRPNCLAVPPETRLSGSTPVDGPRGPTESP
jgi:hypothetical protein